MPDGIAFVLTSSKERGGFATPIRHLTANALSVEVRGELSANRKQAGAREQTGNCPRRLAVWPRGTIVARGTPMDYIDIVFDGPPSPEGSRFVEVEDSEEGA